eukprot:TRINITY_DN4000_c0_g1_i2.p1 TRINITY_DN4000_c0_g1~~TRINITY_DN4000_c0_g1_i2.p1  ORF type:complete len:392 (-),score=73.38 TRINITY_DN4000_c0_g1_i2:148-1323(-)
MWFQWFSFLGTSLTLIEFIIQFSTLPFDFSMSPAWGTEPAVGQAMVVGVVTFTCAFVITIPSWVNEKRDSVNVNYVVWTASAYSLLLKFMFGWFAACTFPNPRYRSNFLNLLSAEVDGPLRQITKIAVYVFNISAMIPGIPVYSIMVKYNLLTSRITGPFGAFIFAVVVPWLLSVFFYHGKGFSTVVNWSALVFQGFVNFVIPCILFYKARTKYPYIHVPPQFDNTKFCDHVPLKLPGPSPVKEKDTSVIEGVGTFSEKSGLLPVGTFSEKPGHVSAGTFSEKSGPIVFSEKPEVTISDEGETKIESSGVNPILKESDAKTGSESSEMEIVNFNTYKPPSLEDVYVDAVPDFLHVNPKNLAIAFAVFMSLLSVASIVLDVVLTVLGYQNVV